MTCTSGPSRQYKDFDVTDSARYQLIVRGEVGDRFGFLFAGMNLERHSGVTVITGMVVDQSHLHGLIDRTQELGLDLISVDRLDDGLG